MRKFGQWLADTVWLAGSATAAWALWMHEQGLSLHMAP